MVRICTGVPVCLPLVVHFGGIIVLSESAPLTWVKQFEYVVAFVSAPVKFGIDVAANVFGRGLLVHTKDQ